MDLVRRRQKDVLVVFGAELQKPPNRYFSNHFLYSQNVFPTFLSAQEGKNKAQFDRLIKAT